MNQTTLDPAGATVPSLNPDALHDLVGQVINDLGAAANGALVILGDRLGIYAALAEAGLATSEELARKTGLDERQLREWLSAQAASGYVSYDAAREAFSLTPEQARSSPIRIVHLRSRAASTRFCSLPR